MTVGSCKRAIGISTCIGLERNLNKGSSPEERLVSPTIHTLDHLTQVKEASANHKHNITDLQRSDSRLLKKLNISTWKILRIHLEENPISLRLLDFFVQS